MPPLNASLEQLLTYLKDKATRYGAIARDNLDRAEIWARGTDQFKPNPRLAGLYEQAAKTAMDYAQSYAGYALWLSMLRPLEELQPGEQTLVPVTFLRRAAGEDFPGEGFVRIAGVADPIRLPLQSTATA